MIALTNRHRDRIVDRELIKLRLREASRRSRTGDRAAASVASRHPHAADLR